MSSSTTKPGELRSFYSGTDTTLAHYAYLSSSDVVDVKTKKIVANLKDEYGKPKHSEKYLEMAFSNGKLLRTLSQFGEGIPSAVQARLAARNLTSKK